MPIEANASINQNIHHPSGRPRPTLTLRTRTDPSANPLEVPPERPGPLSNPAFLQGSTVQRKGSQTFNALDGIEVPVARDDSRRTVTTHHRHVQHITGFRHLRRVRLEE